MSYISYIASDAPIKEVKNPHCHYLSVNEALAAHITLPDFILHADIDRDKPGVVIWVDNQILIDEENGIYGDDGADDDFAILPFEKSEEIYTEKQYCAILEWNYTAGRAKQIIAYIRELLEHTEEVEIRSCRLGDEAPPQIKKEELDLEELTPEMFREAEHTQVPCCLVVHKPRQPLRKG